MASFKIQCKRVYASPAKEDGFRLLVDRLWPRGISKEKGKIDLWLKDIAPSNELRKWTSHDAEKWPEFLERYKEELKNQTSSIEKLKEIISEEKIVTFLFAAKNEEYNNAIALKYLLKL